MKATIVQLAVAASLVAGSAAQPHHHGHHLLHKKRDAQQKRDVETTYASATVTQYMMGNEKVSADEAQAGLDKGLYVVVGETEPTMTIPTSSASTPSPTSSSSSGGMQAAAVFLEQTTSSSSSTSTPAPTTTSTTSSEAAPTSSAASSSGGSGSSTGGATGIDADFPSGELDCTSGVPTDYGAVPLDHLGYGGWSGLQFLSEFNVKVASAVSNIVTGTSIPTGEFGYYSYACPDGYVKSQWPEDHQGATGQSVGGLLCNAEGKLELTRPDKSKKLCEKGVGNITVKNKMTKVASICRTDYPGTEDMVLPFTAAPGGEGPLANIDSNNYYVWQGKATSLQYYVNPSGIDAETGCQWTCPFDSDKCGNYAPAIIGASRTSSGETFVGIQHNSQTSGTLDYNIDIIGDNSGECYYHVGEGFAQSPDQGCTTSVPAGGSITIVLSN